MYNLKKIFISVFFIFSFFQPAFANTTNLDLFTQNVTYKNDLQADIYYSPLKTQKPAIILIHGGYWSAGDKTEMSDFARALAQKGFFAMNVNYRLLPQNAQKEQTSDITEAIWWLRENGDKYNIDGTKIGVVGLSSGGYLAAWAATHDEINSKGFHSRPNAAVCLYAPWDLTDAGIKDVPQSKPLIEKFCDGQNPADISPCYFVSKAAPPILLIHGDADKIVPISQSTNTYKKLKESHCSCKLVIVHNDNHCFPNTKSYFNAMKMSIKFLESNLK